MVFIDIEEYVELNYPRLNQTHYNVKSQLKRYFDFIKKDPEEYVNEDRDFKIDVKKYFNFLNTTISKGTGKPYAPKSIIVHMSTLRGFLEEHDIIFSPRYWKKLHQKGKGNEIILEDRIPTREELEKILTHANARERAYFLTMLSSGMREKELCLITEDMIDFDSEPVMINIPGTISKTKKKRFTFISVEAKNSLYEWLKIREQYVKVKKERTKGLYDWLEETYGKKIIDKKNEDRIFPYQPLATRVWWQRLLNKSGFIEKDKNTGYFTLHLYTLRKLFNTRMKTSCNNYMVEMWMGHKIQYDYHKWTVDEHKKEYLKGMENLLVYRTSANVEELEILKKKVDDIKILEKKLNEMNEAMLGLLKKK